MVDCCVEDGGIIGMLNEVGLFFCFFFVYLFELVVDWGDCFVFLDCVVEVWMGDFFGLGIDWCGMVLGLEWLLILLDELGY